MEVMANNPETSGLPDYLAPRKGERPDRYRLWNSVLGSRIRTFWAAPVTATRIGARVTLFDMAIILLSAKLKEKKQLA